MKSKKKVIYKKECILVSYGQLGNGKENVMKLNKMT